MLSGNGLANWSFSYDPVTKGRDQKSGVSIESFIYIDSILCMSNFQGMVPCHRTHPLISD